MPVIKKVKVSKDFSFEFTLTSQKDAHGKFEEKKNDIDQIIQIGLDSMKIRIQQFLDTIDQNKY